MLGVPKSDRMALADSASNASTIFTADVKSFNLQLTRIVKRIPTLLIRKSAAFALTPMALLLETGGDKGNARSKASATTDALKLSLRLLNIARIYV